MKTVMLGFILSLSCLLGTHLFSQIGGHDVIISLTNEEVNHCAESELTYVGEKMAPNNSAQKLTFHAPADMIDGKLIIGTPSGQVVELETVMASTVEVAFGGLETGSYSYSFVKGCKVFHGSLSVD